MQSAVECTASDSMLELPVKAAATYLLAATSRLAASAVQITFPVASAMVLGQSPPWEVRRDGPRITLAATRTRRRFRESPCRRPPCDGRLEALRAVAPARHRGAR